MITRILILMNCPSYNYAIHALHVHSLTPHKVLHSSTIHMLHMPLVSSCCKMGEVNDGAILMRVS